MDKSKTKPTVKSLMDTIGKLKSEHQRTVFKLNKKIEKLSADLSFERQQNMERENSILALQSENKELLSQIEPLKCKVNSTREYAVEKILDDKIVNKKKTILCTGKVMEKTRICGSQRNI